MAEQVHDAGATFHQMRSEAEPWRMQVHLAGIDPVLDQELLQFSFCVIGVHEAGRGSVGALRSW